MSIEELCQWLENSTVGTTIIGSNWLFPIIETAHVMALGLAVGLVVLSDLRLTTSGDTQNRPYVDT